MGLNIFYNLLERLMSSVDLTRPSRYMSWISADLDSPEEDRRVEKLQTKKGKWERKINWKWVQKLIQDLRKATATTANPAAATASGQWQIGKNADVEFNGSDGQESQKGLQAKYNRQDVCTYEGVVIETERWRSAGGLDLPTGRLADTRILVEKTYQFPVVHAAIYSKLSSRCWYRSYFWTTGVASVAKAARGLKLVAMAFWNKEASV